MGKTIRVNNARVKNGKGCKRTPMEDQLIEVKEALKGHVMQENQTPQDFLNTFHLNTFSVDTKFPNQFNEPVEVYVARNKANYCAVIVSIKEMFIELHNTDSDRPLVNEFNWVLMAMDHNIDLDKVMFDQMTNSQKSTLINMLMTEAEIRLTMFESIPVNSISPVTSTPTPESEIKMNTTTTQDNIDSAAEAIAKAAKSAAEAAIVKAVDTAEAAKQAAEKVADATEEATDKIKDEVKAKGISKKTWKIAAYVTAGVAVVGAALYVYKKHMGVVSAALADAVVVAGDAASEQVVGG